MELEEQIIKNLKKIIKAVNTYSNSLKSKTSLNSSQLESLEYIDKYDSLTLSDLGKLIGLSPSMLTIIVDQLENKSMVKRVFSKTDRRKTTLKITTLGREILVNAPLNLNKKLEKSFSGISPEKKKEILESLNTLLFSIEFEEIEKQIINSQNESTDPLINEVEEI